MEEGKKRGGGGCSEEDFLILLSKLGVQLQEGLVSFREWTC